MLAQKEQTGRPSARVRTTVRVLLLTAFLGPIGARPAAAWQQTVASASLSGTVVDESGAVIPGATVNARQTDTNVTSTSVTDGRGRFHFANLPIGPYELTTVVSGFKPVRRVISLSVGSAFDLRVVLEINPKSVDIIVDDFIARPPLEVTRSQTASTVLHEEVDALPLNGRSFLDIALVAPGVSPTNVGGGTQLFPETSAVPGVGLSVSSQRNFSNSFVVDGVSANDDAAGLSGIPVGVDAVEELQVITSGGQAELGRALGGYVNLVTRGGTNTWKGSGYGYFRDDALNGTNALSGTKLPMHQNQYGLTIGGPLVSNRTFVFGNVERRDLDQTGFVTIADANVAAINARLAAVGYAGQQVTTGIYPDPIKTWLGLAKVDEQVTDADRLNVRYNLYEAKAQNARGAGGLVAPSASTGLDNLDQAVAVSNVWTMSPYALLESRVQFTRSHLEAPPSDPIGPAVAIAGVASFGTAAGAPTARLNSLVQAVNSVSVLAGSHTLKGGVDVLYNDLDITYPRAVRGSYSFPNLNAFLAGLYGNAGFTQTFGATSVSQTNPNLGLYAQDDWRVGSRLTLSGGLRYDLQWMRTIVTDTNNISPRAGLVLTLDKDGRTLIRANAGLFYDRVPLRAVANAILSANNTTDLGNLEQIGVSLSPAQAGAPVFPAILAAPIPSVTLVNLTTMDPHLQNASSHQASIEIERQIGNRLTVSAGYDYLRGRQLIMAINQNVPSCVAAGSNNGCRPNPNYANNSQYSAAGSSQYDALRLTLVQHPGSWGQVRVSYTYSKAMNNVGEAFFNGPIDPFDLSKDWGRSDDDQRHRLVVSGSVNTPSGAATTAWQHVTHGFQVSGMWQTYSALPFNIVSGVNTIQGTAARPVVDGAFIPRNAGVGDEFSSLGLRLSRTFRLGGRARLEGLVEAFNLLNTRNDVARNTNFGTGAYPTSPLPTFGEVTVVGEPRSVQFGIRYRF